MIDGSAIGIASIPAETGFEMRRISPIGKRRAQGQQAAASGAFS